MFSQAGRSHHLEGRDPPRDVPASLESLLPSLHTLPSFLVSSICLLLCLAQQTLTCISQTTLLPITHPPSFHTPYPSSISRPHYHLLYRFLDNNTTTTSPSPSPPARSRHSAAAAGTSTSPAHSFALSQEQRKEDTAARATASRWYMNTNLILQTTRIVRSASLRELSNATSVSIPHKQDKEREPYHAFNWSNPPSFRGDTSTHRRRRSHRSACK